MATLVLVEAHRRLSFPKEEVGVGHAARPDRGRDLRGGIGRRPHGGIVMEESQAQDWRRRIGAGCRPKPATPTSPASPASSTRQVLARQGAPGAHDNDRFDENARNTRLICAR